MYFLFWFIFLFVAVYASLPYIRFYRMRSLAAKLGLSFSFTMSEKEFNLLRHFQGGPENVIQGVVGNQKIYINDYFHYGGGYTRTDVFIGERKVDDGERLIWLSTRAIENKIKNYTA